MAQIETSPPRWRVIYEIISGRIRSGEYKIGERIPSIITMIEEFGSANATIQKVMRQLRADGLITTEPGMGSFVADREHWEPKEPA